MTLVDAALPDAEAATARATDALTVARDQGGDRTDAVNRSAVVDMLRAVAALSVLVAHSSLIATGAGGTDVIKPLRQMLGAGVLLFFGISGYLIAGPYLRALAAGDPLPRASAYLVRRAARIYPAYWIALGCVILFLMPTGGIKPYQVPVHALLLHSSWPVPGETTAICFVGWTLGIEFAFYLFVPLAAAILRAVHPKPWRVRDLVLLVVAGWAATSYWHGHAYSLGTHSHLRILLQVGLQMWLFAFCPGMLIALAGVARPGRVVRSALSALRPLPVVLGVVAIWAVVSVGKTTYSIQGNGLYEPLYSIFCGLLVWAAFSAGPGIRRPARVLAPVGLISYGIYLWHFVVIEMIRRHSSLGLHGGVAAWIGDVAMVAAFTLPLAALSWFRVEKPLMQRAAAWARRGTRRPAAAEAASA